ncbi:MAG: aminoacyl-tRNA hydrolase [Actinomycetota bacterium]|nr:aminoacyl-tRNA hydrolase [Acidimicrobiia bacterium]MDQ3469966.1 aminoacyl-tRNA hydrolase [Actinomycetota bacterium]
MRRSTPFDWLIVGLGNPGKEYARTRHNVGEEVVTELARRRGDTMRGGRDNALVAESRLAVPDGDDQRCVLAFPLTYMNDSGQAVRALVRRYGIEDPARIVVVHDELDLPPTTVRVKVGGGLAGHNGLRSITQHLHTQDFVRIRIGVGKPPSKERGAGHVLSRLPARQREIFDVAVQEAADAAELIVTDGADAAMRAYNIRALPEP